MTSSFVRWEKDPFFSVAEEVQQSADRMETTYRTWMHAVKDGSPSWSLEELDRDLRTALSTTKWQLEEFEKAVRLSYGESTSEEAIDRHRDFSVAIKDQISRIEKHLQESTSSESKPSMHLDESECNELALFLAAPPLPGDKKPPRKVRGRDNEFRRGTNRESAPDFLKNVDQSIEWSSSEANDRKPQGHRRISSAADLGAWKIAIVDDGLQKNWSNGKPHVPTMRVPSSGSLSSTESAGKGMWSKNSNRKWKTMSRHQQSDAEMLRPPELARGNEESYDKNRGVDCDDKQLRSIRRSQYQKKSCCSFPLTASVVLIICFIILLVLHSL